VRILFAGKQHFETGGIDRNTDQLAVRLLARGHDVGVMAPPRVDMIRGSNRPIHGVEEVHVFDYRTWTVNGITPGEALSELLRTYAPEVLVVNAGGRWFHDWTRPLLKVARDRVPSVLYLHDTEALELLAERGIEPDAVWGCADTRTRLAHAAGYDDAITISPLVEPELYRTTPTGEVVLFINPVKVKGLRTAITLAAARPDIPFVFLRSWNLQPGFLEELRAMIAALGNVELAGPTPDPREYYARARVLLAPYDDLSRPRVVTEAQLSGIPVVAYDDEGFREAVGAGGILVRRDGPLGEWVGALGRIWDDDTEHALLSAAALAHSRRPDADPDAIVAAVEASITDVVARFTRRERRAPAADAAAPLVSVVLPVRNAGDTIDEQLTALSRQTYTGDWELVISDNGSTDGTMGRAAAWEGGLPIRFVDASQRRGVAHARNVGISAAHGDYILICDADDVVSSTWMEHMVDALHEHDIVTGRGDRTRLNPPELYEWMGDVDQTDAETNYGYRRYAAGGNLGVRREVAIALAGFDETLLRGEDMDWSWRAQYAGYDVHFERDAVVHYRHSPNPYRVARTWFRSGTTEPLLYRRHRDHGLQPAPREEVLDTWRWLWNNAGNAWTDESMRHRWLANAALRAGRVVGSIRHRTVFL